MWLQAALSGRGRAADRVALAPLLSPKHYQVLSDEDAGGGRWRAMCVCGCFWPDLSSCKKVEATKLFSKIKAELSEKHCICMCSGKGGGGLKKGLDSERRGSLEGREADDQEMGQGRGTGELRRAQGARKARRGDGEGPRPYSPQPISRGGLCSLPWAWPCPRA